MLVRVSNIETFRRWRDFVPKHEKDAEPTLEEVIADITTDNPSEAMQAGTAFHKAMETATYGAHFELEANGYRFMLPDADLTLPVIREMRAYKDYGPLTVTGQVDGIEGRTIIDHKTTSKIDLERYMTGCQWRFYLDMFEADVFRWHLFEIRETDPKVYGVSAPQELVAYRYPEMGDYCARLAADFLEFAERYLPAGFEAAI